MATSMKTAAKYARGIPKNEFIAGNLSCMPKTHMVIEISSKEPTPEIVGSKFDRRDICRLIFSADPARMTSISAF